MKYKLIITVFALLIVLHAKGQNEKRQEIKAEIKSLTIYLVGAEVTHEANINILQGRNLLVFTNLSPKLDPKSVRLSLGNDVSILNISSKINYLLKPTEVPRIKQLKDSLKLIKDQLAINNGELEAYKIEKDMLEKNLSIGGANSGVEINQLKQTSEYIRTRIIEINKKVYSLSNLIDDNTQIINRLNSELESLNADINYTRMEISVLVDAEKTLTQSAELKYLVSDAGWSPSYDIKTEDVSLPINLIYRAKVYNNTDIDWINENITLSTANPSLSITKPSLSPWYLNYETAYNNAKMQESFGYMQNMYYNNMPSSVAGLDIIQSEYDPGNLLISNEFTEVEVSDLNTDFKIEKPYNIPSDNNPYLVDIAEHSLPATYKYYAVTKLDKDVFLLAQIAGWQDFNLVDGPANVYYCGTFVGQSNIVTRNVHDTLDLSMGRDNKVIVTRTKLKDYSDKQLIGSKVTETYTFELVAKNNRKQNIDMEIFDQIPIAQTDEIEVKVLNISGGEHNLTTGEVKWKLNLAPNETKKLVISFSIKYPKNKPIAVEQVRKMQMRAF